MNLVVEGMTCGHCVRTVTQAIQALDPHAQVDVDLGSGVVKIEGLLAVEQAVEAIQRQGYVIAAVLPSEAVRRPPRPSHPPAAADATAESARGLDPDQ